MSEDLLGDELSDLLMLNKSGNPVLSTQAGDYLPLNQGAIYLWPDALSSDVDLMPSFSALIKQHTKQFESWPRSFARSGDRVTEVFESLFVDADFDVMFKGQYRCATRNAIMDHLKARKIKVLRDQVSRIQQQLIEYGYLRVLVESQGRKPALLQIVYPFMPNKPVEDKPITVVTPVVDIPASMPIVDHESDRQVFRELVRQIAHRGRPHEHTDLDGKQIKSHKGRALVRRQEDGSKFTLEMESTVKHNSKVAVMNKVDDELYQQLLHWCRSTQRKHFERTGSFLTWYSIEPKALALYYGYKKPRPEVLSEMRELIERWLQTTLATRIETDVVKGQVNEDGDPLEALLKDTELNQFKDYEKFSERLSDGTERLVALKFQLPDDTEKDIRRRAKGDRDSEDLIGNLPRYIANGPILRDSLALAMSAFYHNHARRYRREPWSAPLKEGLEDVFDFDLSDPPPSIKGTERKRIKDTKNIRFNNLFFKFLDKFTDDPDAMRDVWLGIHGGEIRTNEKLPECVLIIQIEPRRARTMRKSGRVTVLQPNHVKVIGYQTDTQNSDFSSAGNMNTATESLVALGIVRSKAEKWVSDKGAARVKEVLTYVAARADVENPAGYITKLLKSDADLSTSRTTPNDEKADTRSRRRKVTDAIMDIKNTDW